MDNREFEFFFFWGLVSEADNGRYQRRSLLGMSGVVSEVRFAVLSHRNFPR